MSLWILNKSLCLVVTPLQKRKQRCGPFSARYHKVQVSHSAFIDTWRWGFSLLLGDIWTFWLSYRLPLIFSRLRGVEVFHYLSSPFGLCWHHGMGGGIITAGQWSDSLLSTRTPLTPLEQRRGHCYCWAEEAIQVSPSLEVGRGTSYGLARMKDLIPIWHSLKPPWQGCWSALL